MLNNRKDLILLLLYMPGAKGELEEPIRGRTRLMKMLYLLQEDHKLVDELKLENEFNFSAYHYGPFSKDIYDDIEFLENLDLITTSPGGLANLIDQDEQELILRNISLGESDDDAGGVYEEEYYCITPSGKQFVIEKLLPSAPNKIQHTIQELKRKLSDVPLSSLLRYVYSKFPESAENTRLEYLKK